MILMIVYIVIKKEKYVWEGSCFLYWFCRGELFIVGVGEWYFLSLYVILLLFIRCLYVIYIGNLLCICSEYVYGFCFLIWYLISFFVVKMLGCGCKWILVNIG